MNRGNGEIIGYTGNTKITSHREPFVKLRYNTNRLSKECCICLEQPSRLYECSKCNDGKVCCKCYKQNTKLKNFVYPKESNCICNAGSLTLITYKCPICRDYRGEDLNHETIKRCEFTDKEILDKILLFNTNNINEFNEIGEYINDDEHYESDDENINYDDYGNSDSDNDEDGICLEDSINESIELPNYHGLTGEERNREADRQSRYIDIIQNVYPLNILFDEHFLYSDY